MGESADPHTGQGQSLGAPQDRGGEGASARQPRPGGGDTGGREARVSGPAQVVPLACCQNVDPLPSPPPALIQASEPACENCKWNAKMAWVPLSLRSDLWWWWTSSSLLSRHDALSSQDLGCSSVLGEHPEAVLTARALHRLPRSCAWAPTFVPPRTHAWARRPSVQTTQGPRGRSPRRCLQSPYSHRGRCPLPVPRTRILAPPYAAGPDCSPLSIWVRSLLPDPPVR